MYSTTRTSGHLEGSSGRYGSSPQYGSHGQYDTSSRYSSGGQYGQLSSPGQYNSSALGSHDRYGGGGSSYGSRLDNDRDLNYNRPDSGSSYTRESPYNKDYTSRVSARDSSYGSTSTMYGSTKDRRGSTLGSNRDVRDNDRYKAKDLGGYGTKDRDISSYNRENLTKGTKDYNSYKKDSISYGRDIYGDGREKSRLKDSSYLSSRRDSDYLDEEDIKMKGGNGKGKKKKRKNPITCNLSGTRYEVGELNVFLTAVSILETEYNILFGIHQSLPATLLTFSYCPFIEWFNLKEKLNTRIEYYFFFPFCLP